MGDCADGAVYVQICDSIFTLKDSQMRKVKWNSKSTVDWNANWKIVQDCFNKFEVTKSIDVAKITNGKFQDNLEVMQWFKHFHQCKFSGTYEAKKRRNLSKSAPKTSKKPKKRQNTPTDYSIRVEKKASKKPNQKKKGKNQAKEEKIMEAMSELEKANLTIEAVEKERNFYFGKLREIEILCQDHEDTNVDPDKKKFKNLKELQDAILGIMYKTDDAGMMESPEEGDGGVNEVY